MTPRPLRTAVLISGSGTNLRALIEARDQGRLALDLCHVISSRRDAPGLKHAERAGISTTVVQHDDAAEQDRAILARLAPLAPELIVLAGYMRILGPEAVTPFAGRMINLHPSLLPRYKGLDTYRRALAAGDTEHGASIHFVTADLDAGPVIAQVRIPVLQGDSPATLASRLAPREHELLCATVELFTRRRVECSQDRVLLDGMVLAEPLQLDENGQLYNSH